MTVIDAAFLQRVRQLDEAALTEVFDTFSPAIYAYAMRLLGDQDLAYECVAETFSRLLVALQRGGGPDEHLRAYLYRVAHNWITDQYRRQPEILSLDIQEESDGNPFANAIGLMGREAASVDPPLEMERRTQQVRVRQALSKLTPDQRQVVVLKFLEDIDHAEIARMMNKPVGAIKSLQHRALDALRRLLEPQELFL
jgi:RNA polymerase sigma-70 factor, ECF subfamily